MTDQKDPFNDAVQTAINEGIVALFSQEVLEALYQNLEERRGIKREDVPNQLSVLCDVLEKYFGPSGHVICTNIARRLYSKLELPFQVRAKDDLINYVEDAKRQLAPGQVKT